MQVLRQLLNGQPIDFHGEFVDLTLDPPRAEHGQRDASPDLLRRLVPGRPGVAAAEADVFLTWPDTVENVAATVDEMTARASERHDRSLVYGFRAHMIVRETEAEARAAADRLVSRLDADTGEAIRNKSLDAASVGVQRQAACANRPPTTASPRTPSGLASAGHDQVPARRSSATRPGGWRSSGRTRRPASAHSSCRATPTSGNATWWPNTSCRALTTLR